MRFIFKVAAATALSASVAPATAQSDDQQVNERNPKHMKYSGIFETPTWVQVNSPESVDQASFVETTLQAAKFIDSKTGEENYMRCQEVIFNEVYSAHFSRQKAFRKQLALADAALGCTSGPPV